MINEIANELSNNYSIPAVVTTGNQRIVTTYGEVTRSLTGVVRFDGRALPVVLSAGVEAIAYEIAKEILHV